MIIIKIKENDAEIVREERRQTIRRFFDKETGIWYFSIVDVIGTLIDTADARNYWKVLKNRLNKRNKELVTKCNQLKMLAKDGKYYLTDTADSTTMLQIIEAIPKASSEAFRILLEDLADSTSTPSMSAVEEVLPEDTVAAEAKLLVDAYQDGDTIYIEAMIAGVAPEDLTVSVGNKKVVIEGRREIQKEIKELVGKENYIFEELFWTSFARIITLPFAVQKDNVETSHENGRLQIKLKKS